MKRTELNFVQKVWLESLWLGARVFAMMPYWFKYYIVENLLFFIIYYCLRYRMKVVKANLRNSFPEKSEQERAAVCRSFYRTLAEIFVDTVNMAHMGEEKGRTVLTVKGFEEHYAKVHGRDWIAMTAHFGCWEYCSYWGLYERSQMLVAVYHPLRSKVMECLYQRLRNYENSMTVAMKDSLRFYLRNRERGIEGKNLVMGLISDQNPPRLPDSHWFRFLNQDRSSSTAGRNWRCAVTCRSISSGWSACSGDVTRCRSNRSTTVWRRSPNTKSRNVTLDVWKP